MYISGLILLSFFIAEKGKKIERMLFAIFYVSSCTIYYLSCRIINLLVIRIYIDVWGVLYGLITLQAGHRF